MTARGGRDSDRELDLELDLERAEHERAGRLHWFELERRAFLKLLGGGILVCASGAAPQAAAQESGQRPRGEELPTELSAWIHVGQDGRITAHTGKVEMGQNIRTSLAQHVAEELRVPVESIEMVMGDTDRTPWDAGTFGSRTTPTMGPQLRKMAAAAREALLEIAAERWKVDRAAVTLDHGRVLNAASRQAIAYGELTRGRELVRTVGVEPALTQASQWKIAGSSIPKVNGRAFVTGAHLYTSDLSRPGMLHGKVVRPSGFRAKLASLDSREAEKTAGARVVRDGDFVGVVAPDLATAERAVTLVKAQWNVPPQPGEKELFQVLTKTAASGERSRGDSAGSTDAALASADVKAEQTYTVSYIAHAPLEPRAALAEWSGDRLTVWTGTQRPFAVRDELAEVFRIPSEKVRVIVPDTGSAYGGKHTGDAAVEAARLAKAAGRPVKLVWTREEEFTWAYFRPAGVIQVKAGARRDGTLVAWEFHNFNSGPAALGTPYDVPNRSVQFHPSDSPLRQGSYRALAATANHFARESHMDVLAAAARMDPLEFRLKNLSNPRLKAVLEAAAQRFGWATRARGQTGRGCGLAAGTEKGSYIATCVEVESTGGAPPGGRIRRVVQAFECGAVVNPNGLRNQIEGAIVQAIGGALFEAVKFENGRITNAHFSQYRLPRFTDVPQIDVVILDRKDLPSAGAGETPIVGLAPAVANAIQAATNVRLVALPLVPKGFPTPVSL